MERTRTLLCVIVALSLAVPTLTAWQRSTGTVPFASSLQIAPPGPQPDGDRLNYRFKLLWTARPGAGAYRVLMWTDAARSWYRITQTSDTTVDAHAFRSGCSAFVVIALADPHATGEGTAGLESSNLLRFPLSVNPSLCPTQFP